MNKQTALRSGEVASSEAAILRLFDNIMCGPNVCRGSVHPETEEPTRRHEPLGNTEVGKSLSSASMLEHLDTYHDAKRLP